MAKIQVFLDTDVIISSLLSKKGASYELIKSDEVEKIISKFVEKETKQVGQRLNVDSQDVNRTIKYTKAVTLNLTKKNILNKYKDYVFDEEDSHVVAGAHKSKSRFLLTHNTRHYQIDKIKNSLGIIVLKPGRFLQYLRSKGRF